MRSVVRKLLPEWKNALLALLSAVLLILAFPDFDYWFLAWFALAPLMWAVEREKESKSRSFVLGWIFGTVFFFGTCWWLTYAPITYAGFPPILAYFLLFCVCLVAGTFPGLFAAILSVLLRRFGTLAFLAAPFVWVSTEFLRYWITGNNWNALGYSQAYAPLRHLASVGGVPTVSFYVASVSSAFALVIVAFSARNRQEIRSRIALLSLLFWLSPFAAVVVFIWQRSTRQILTRSFFRRRILWRLVLPLALGISLGVLALFIPDGSGSGPSRPLKGLANGYVVALQPNVPMSGLDYAKWNELRRRHVQLGENGLKPNFEGAIEHEIKTFSYEDRGERLKGMYEEQFVQAPKIVIFPESPMNFMYETDPETRQFIDGFARKNNVSILFNSAEPDEKNGKFFNSAVMVGPQGGEVAQYDKIYLLPFGEAVPFPLEGILPGFVGNFSYGKEYDLFPLGDAKAGVMICFESHFGALSREYVRNGADAIIEMTNDGYLGPTPVLRQHLANAVFRAVETNRPVLRVTNVGITGYINEKGEVLDAAPAYQTDTRVWSVSKSDGSQTFYVRYGDWFAWLCTIVTMCMLGIATLRLRRPVEKDLKL